MEVEKKKIGFWVAIAIVIANMVGTGVFTSLGFQLFDIKSFYSIMLLWSVGGIIALCGALTYAEIGTRIKGSGGEYLYLSKIYHPALGFASGWVSALVGFSAPVALASMALGKYSSSILGIDSKIIAISVVLLLSLLNAINSNAGYSLQKYFTWLKVTLILIFIAIGLFSPLNFISPQDDFQLSDIIQAPFAVSLMYVLYAYSGWNASVYIAGEIKNPQKNLPKSLIIGTVIVMLLYVGLNYIFMKTAPISSLRGNLEVGSIAATSMLGISGGKIMSIVISLLLVSTISAMIIAGPRITSKMGDDINGLNFLNKFSINGSPTVPIFLQTSISIVLIMTSQFENILTYTTFTLYLFSLLTVAGIFVLRAKKNTETFFKTPLYPIVPILYCVMLIFTLYQNLINKTTESIYGLITALSGVILFLILQPKKENSIPVLKK